MCIELKVIVKTCLKLLSWNGCLPLYHWPMFNFRLHIQQAVLPSLLISLESTCSPCGNLHYCSDGSSSSLLLPSVLSATEVRGVCVCVCVCIAHVGYTCMSVGIWVCLHVYVLWVWVRVCVSERERVLECAFLWFVNILCTFYSSFDIMLLGLHNVSPLFVWLFFILVYCACCLGSHNVQGLGDHELRPHFYINVADIETLENEISFIACELFIFLQEQPWSLKTWLFGFFKCLCALHPSTQ